MVKVRQRKPAYRTLFVYSEPGAFFLHEANKISQLFTGSQTEVGGKKKKERLWKCGGGN